MKQLCKSIIVFFLTITTLSLTALFAQTKEDIFNSATPVTWLGLDFSKTKVFGTAAQFGNVGEITNVQMRDKYIPEWNQLFINEMKKYDIANAIHRMQVKFELDVTAKANQNIKDDFFTNNFDDLNTLDSKKIETLVAHYDFNNQEGIGLMFFVEGMNKPKTEISCWVTFVNMKTKKVLLTQREVGKVGGIGFRNYWAKGFFTILKDMKSDYYNWKK